MTKATTFDATHGASRSFRNRRSVAWQLALRRVARQLFGRKTPTDAAVRRHTTCLGL